MCAQIGTHSHVPTRKSSFPMTMPDLSELPQGQRRAPELYSRIREVRLAQLRVRHRFAMQNARAHSRRYFRRRARNRRLYGY